MATAFRRSGFSLVELLTVIAIIAILAAIIFPVMGAVKRRAQENQCMTNLHQIAMGVQMYKYDNHTYPRILGSEVRNANGDLYGAAGGDPKMFEQVKDKYLFAEYVKSIGAFHCPTSRVSGSKDVALCDVTGATAESTLTVYVYDSYDCAITGTGDSKGAYMEYSEMAKTAERHYMTRWADEIKGTTGAVTGYDMGGLKPYPPSTPDDLGLQKDDYARQLRFRNPPGDTVVTWCSYHQTTENVPPDEGGGVRVNGKALVVYLDGHADQIPAAEMADCRWRARPKKT